MKRRGRGWAERSERSERRGARKKNVTRRCLSSAWCQLFSFLLSMIFCLQMAEKHREQSSGQERQREGERQRETETERDREREKEKEREREREGERNERDREARY